MVLVSRGVNPTATRELEAEVLVLHHSSTIRVGYEAVLHCANIRQTVRLTEIRNPDQILRSGGRAKVVMRFRDPVFLRHTDHMFILRSGGAKAIGKLMGAGESI